MISRAILILSMWILSSMAATGARSYFTAITGDDSNSGTQAQPFRSIHRGVLALRPGDTLTIREGVYAEAIEASIPAGESWSTPVTVCAFSGEKVIIRPNASQERAFTFRGPQHHIVISGLIIDGANTPYDCIKITNSTTTGPSHHIRFQECEILNANEQGILVSGGANYNEFRNLKVHNCGLSGRPHKMPLDHYHGFYIATDHNLVSGCSVYHNAGYGIHCYDDSKTSANFNVVRDSRCYDNGVAGLSGAGIILSSGTGNCAFDNVIFGNACGIAVDYSAVDTRVFNNTVYGNRKYGIYVSSRSRATTITNNISFRNGWNPQILDDAGQDTALVTNLSGVDPMFVDAAGSDFHLKSGSPAIGRGTAVREPDSAAEVDTRANRTMRARQDIGAYEHR